MTPTAQTDRARVAERRAWIEQTRRFIARKHARQQARDRELWRQAVQDAERIIGMIVHDFGPRAIYQWGSLLNPAGFDALSDIDLAVEGLGSAERYFALLARAEQLTKFSLDIVEIEHLEPEYAALIRQHGKQVYARPKAKDAREQ